MVVGLIELKTKASKVVTFSPLFNFFCFNPDKGMTFILKKSSRIAKLSSTAEHSLDLFRVPFQNSSLLHIMALLMERAGLQQCSHFKFKGHELDIIYLSAYQSTWRISPWSIYWIKSVAVVILYVTFWSHQTVSCLKLSVRLRGECTSLLLARGSVDLYVSDRSSDRRQTLSMQCVLGTVEGAGRAVRTVKRKVRYVHTIYVHTCMCIYTSEPVFFPWLIFFSLPLCESVSARQTTTLPPHQSRMPSAPKIKAGSLPRRAVWRLS